MTAPFAPRPSAPRSFAPRPRGMTLVEVVIALSLGTLAFGIVGALLVASLSTWRRGQDLREAHGQAAILLAVMTRDVRAGSQAVSVTLRPDVALGEIEPILSLAVAGLEGGDGGLVIYGYDRPRRAVLRFSAVPGEHGELAVKDRRVVAQGVEHVAVTEAGGGVTVETEVRIGRELARSRSSASPRNP